MKILVTGAAGLLGAELVKQLLEKGYTVIAIYNSTPVKLSHENLEIQQCDILDMSALEEIMEGVSNVYHCAAVVSFEPKDKAHLFKINIEGTENIVNACINANVQKLVHVSSVAAIGRIRNGETVNEKMTWTEETSNSIYAKSKYLGELEVWRGIGEGLQAAIVNPSIILGGDNWNDGSSALFKSVYNGFKWYTEGVSGFVDVRDVAIAMIMLMNSKISGERFILNSENLSYKEIFSLMAKGFGKNPPPNKVTPFLAEVVWRLEAIKSLFTGKKKLLTKETARTAQASVKYDNNKFLNAFSPFYFTPIARSIAFTCATLKEKYHL
ncbi:MAG: NAD-dependent epimerase/dehydratase family protein [Ginsengibacter sp.]